MQRKALKWTVTNCIEKHYIFFIKLPIAENRHRAMPEQLHLCIRDMLMLNVLPTMMPSLPSGRLGSDSMRDPLVLEIGRTTKLLVLWKSSTSAAVTSLRREFELKNIIIMGRYIYYHHKIMLVHIFSTVVMHANIVYISLEFITLTLTSHLMCI